MAEIVARFADGRLLVQESRLAPSEIIGDEGSLPFRVGLVRSVEKVLSIGMSSGYTHLVADVGEATVSGDVVHAIWRCPMSSYAYALSGYPVVSGLPTIKANVVGF